MITVRRGNDLPVEWRIFRNGNPEDLSGKHISLYLASPFDRKEVVGYSIDGNVIRFVYPGIYQKFDGQYSLILIENEGLDAMYTVTRNGAFALSSDMEQTDGLAVELDSDIAVPANGLSAYEIAVMHGYIGTEDEWLAQMSNLPLKPGTGRGSLMHVQAYEATGSNSFAEGTGAGTAGSGSHAEGKDSRTSTSAHHAHVEGLRTHASQQQAHAEGSETVASGVQSHAEGSDTVASGMQSHAEGYKSTASGGCSHAEGSQTTASGTHSHAEGDSTRADGNSSHAEGFSTKANGSDSHAEGEQTTASGINSHAEGTNTIASGYSSHAEGQYTQTKNRAEHAEGYYNLSVPGKTIHSVGIGNGDSEDPTQTKHRKNAEEIHTDGRKFIIGVGGYDGTNPTTAKSVQETLLASRNLVKVTYPDLLSLVDSNGLTEGMLYRITDFVTRVANDEEARSAEHQFDIIVTALDDHTLAEEARAIWHEESANDYFFAAGANLPAWKIWYSLKNDVTRFAWADTVNGKGVIYRMIDEWQNDCPYDFKNVQFKRCRTSGTFVDDVVLDSDWENTQYILSPSMNGQADMEVDEQDFVWLYTFNFSDNVDFTAVRDASLIRTPNENFAGSYFNQVCHCNVMKPYFTSSVIDDDTFVIQALNNITATSYDLENGNTVKLYANEWGTGCYNMSFHEHCYRNRWGCDCHDFVGVKFYSNTFGNYCWNNTFGNYCWNNTFGNDCWYNTFGNDCWYNTFGNYCWNNTFGNNCSNTTFGNDCWYNTFGNDCCYNTFGNDCWYNTFGNDCLNTTFGNDCWYNTFGNNCSNTTFGNNCSNTTFGNYVQNCTVFEGVNYVEISTGGSQDEGVHYAQILNGTHGSSAERLAIPFARNVDYCQTAALNSSGALKIWTPADLV